MRFVDEATIRVVAGKGGDGSASFRREKYIPFGGPDGGDGGRGGSIILVGDSGLNTLVDFRHKRLFRAPKGEPGRGRQMTGASGEDIEIRLPLGTVVRDEETGDVIGDVTEAGQKLVVARGGRGGLGNLHFKSSTNRAPKEFTPGAPGEERELRLELRVLADVGLLGFPNAGKSTLIRAVSAAKPRVADYPFTTLYPNLGVVRVDAERSFVIADIPGIIEGAAEGAGLGIQFLKHLQRTHLLLHLVDIAPMDGSDAAEAVRTLEAEMREFDASLLEQPRWLVINKADLLPEDDQMPAAQELLDALGWEGEWALVSAATGQGTEQLVQRIMSALEAMRDAEAEEAHAE
ncbi:MAG: GTPase ObgE [Xanthomonadales bacterium]|nr:GTPase ObgE [Xanthomonadales bacterium]